MNLSLIVTLLAVAFLSAFSIRMYAGEQACSCTCLKMRDAANIENIHTQAHTCLTDLKCAERFSGKGSVLSKQLDMYKP